MGFAEEFIQGMTMGQQSKRQKEHDLQAQEDRKLAQEMHALQIKRLKMEDKLTARQIKIQDYQRGLGQQQPIKEGLPPTQLPPDQVGTGELPVQPADLPGTPSEEMAAPSTTLPAIEELGVQSQTLPGINKTQSLQDMLTQLRLKNMADMVPIDTPQGPQMVPKTTASAIIGAQSREKVAAMPKATTTPGVGRTTEVGGRVKQFNPETQRYDIDVGKAPERGTGFNATNLTDLESEAIADAIISGDQPPEVKGLFRNGAKVKAKLAQKKYNLSAANLDWTAAQTHVKTLNGRQQTQLRQSINTASELVDSIEENYDKLELLAPLSGFRIVNKATMSALKNIPGDAGAIATKIEAQIADLVADMSNVYMGGGSPTDHSMKLGAKNLDLNWTPKQFREALDLLRTNIRIRRNSILQTPAVSLVPGSPYAPPTAGTGEGSSENPLRQKYNY